VEEKPVVAYHRGTGVWSGKRLRGAVRPPNSPMSIVDGVFAVLGFLAFLGLSLSALSDHIYKSEE